MVDVDKPLPDRQFLEPLSPVLMEHFNRSSILVRTDCHRPPLEPSKIEHIISEIEKILFPGYFSSNSRSPISFLDRQFALIKNCIAEQILCAFKHCGQDETTCHAASIHHACTFLLSIPSLWESLEGDVQAVLDGDPAAQSVDEVIYCYPGIKAVYIYRIAHQLFLQGVPLVPRVMGEYAHRITGIDIHPGATIGKNFFIDHGTGVVIGETTIIGDNVRIYQGVTLGALTVPRDSSGQSVRGQKRHPTIEDDVTIYAETTILGDTVVGKGSIIGGNVWLTTSVEPYTKVLLEPPQLVFRTPSTKNKDSLS